MVFFTSLTPFKKGAGLLLGTELVDTEIGADDIFGFTGGCLNKAELDVAVEDGLWLTGVDGLLPGAEIEVLEPGGNGERLMCGEAGSDKAAAEAFGAGKVEWGSAAIAAARVGFAGNGCSSGGVTSSMLSSRSICWSFASSADMASRFLDHTVNNH